MLFLNIFIKWVQRAKKIAGSRRESEKIKFYEILCKLNRFAGKSEKIEIKRHTLKKNVEIQRKMRGIELWKTLWRM